MAPKVVLITGANRGLGFGLAKDFLARPETTVIAAVRNLSNATFDHLKSAEGSSVVVVKYDAGVEEDAFRIVQELRTQHKIERIDIVVANAGIAKVMPTVKDLKRADVQEHIEVNVYGVIALYQATRPLLKESPNQPIFAIMGSSAGTLGRQPPIPNAAYGASKSILPWYAVRINSEDEWLNTFVIDPGWAQTDMGYLPAKLFNMEPPQTVDETTAGVYQVLNSATKEKYGGKVVMYTGEVAEW